jgi:hypothetical protein
MFTQKPSSLNPELDASLASNGGGEATGSESVPKLDVPSTSSTGGEISEIRRELDALREAIEVGDQEVISSFAPDEDDDSSSSADEEEVREFENLAKKGLVRYIVRSLFCRHQRTYIKCGCIYKAKMNGGKYYFDEAMLDDLVAICYELRLREFSKTKTFDAGDHYYHHHATILALTTKDKRLVCDPKMDRGRFLKFIYELREHYGICTDYGQKQQTLDIEFEAQSLGEYLSGFIDIVKGGTTSAFKTVAEIVDKVFQKIKEGIVSVVGLITETLGRIFDAIFSKLRDAIVKRFDPVAFIKDASHEHGYSKMIVIMCVLLVTLVIDILGILTWKISIKLVDRFIDYFQTDKYVGQGPSPDPVAGVITLAGLVLGLTRFDMATLSKKAREVTSLVAGGVATTFALSSLFLVLPVTIQSALKMKFGTKESKELMIVEEWLIRASAVIRLKRIPKVLVSEDYFRWLQELITEAQGLRTKIKNPTLGNLFVRNLVSMSEIISILENYRKEKSYRDLPYSLHIAAPPGYGKTLFISKFCVDLFDVMQRDIYTRPIASEFWDGYINQNVVVVDEFLIGDTEQKQKLGREYLELVSTKTFKPPMASVDDPAVGIKGTRADPIGVLTLNNSAYEKVSGLSNNALWRRREFVIELRIAPGYEKYMTANKIDLNRLTDDQIRDRSWLKFNLLPAEPNTGSKVKNLSYTELIALLRQHRERHVDTCKRIREGQESEIDLDQMPEQMLEDIMREIRGIPNEPLSLSDAIFGVFSDMKDGFENVFVAQGPEEFEKRSMDENAFRKPKEGTKLRTAYNRLKKINKKISIEKAQAVINTAQDEFLDAYTECCLNPPKEIKEDFDSMRKMIFKYGRRYGVNVRLSSVSTESSEYDSCEEEPSLPVQKEIIAKIDHSNVDPSMVHRHTCLCTIEEPVMCVDGKPLINSATQKPVMKTLACGRNFAHKHKAGEVHPMICVTCQNEGKKEDYRLLHGGAIPAQIPRLPDLLPDDYEPFYCGEPEGFAEKMNDYWLKVCVDKFLHFGTTPVILIEDLEHNIYCDIPSVKDSIFPTLRNVGIWVGIFVLIHAVRKFFKKDKSDVVDEICFAQSSPRPTKETRKSRSAKRFSSAHAQSGYNLTFEINGQVHNAIPIKGQTFLTYYHAFLQDGVLLEDNTEIKLKWRGQTAVFNFHDEMIRASIEDDIAFVTFYNPKVSHFPDNTKRFWTLDDVENFSSTSAIIEIDENPRYVTVTKAKNKNYSFLNKKFEMDECLMYKYPTKRGDCGSPIVAVGQQFPGKIMGMHVAGGSTGFDSYGLGVIITREDVEEALKPIKLPDTDAEFSAQGPDVFHGPNLERIESIPISEQIHVNRRTKIRKSCLSPYLDTVPQKHLPLMSSLDPRAEGQDPLINMVNDSLDIEHVYLDQELINEVKEAALESYEKNLIWPIGRRQLTFEEALCGIPGKLSSMKVLTSAGYPLCKLAKKKGKKDWFRFGPNGELEYEPYFRTMVEEYLEEIKTNGPIERRFVAFLKDELVSSSKIEEKRCRIIYCGDLISNTAYRMLYGSLLAAFNASFFTTSSAVGLNQYSHDMHVIYDTLREVGKSFVAGDFKNFDKRVHPQFQSAAYSILMELAGSLSSQLVKNNFVHQQCYSPAQVLDVLICFKTTHFSGCFFTTIVNVIVHELYLRHVFAQLCPQLSFDENVRAKIVGDDHIYCFSDEAKEVMTPWNIRDEMAKIGQVYTSDVKNEELKNEFRAFEDITFLGAHPKLIRGKYCGALKKSTLEETLHWTRNSNLTIRDEAECAIELSSIWGKDYYRHFANNVNEALVQYGLLPILIKPHSEMTRIVCSRTAASGSDFPYGFVAQGPPENSLAKLNEHKVTYGAMLNMSGAGKLESKAVNEEQMNLNFGTDSRVFRGQFEWSTSAVAGAAIASYDVPFGLLALGDSDNVQNMGFDRFVFWTGDVEIVFQINGTPFQQGLLAAYFVPLASYEVELANITSCSHVMIQPDQSATYSLTIPYMYLRSVMNTIARDTESLGTVYVTPLSALSSVDTESTTVTVYSSYPNSKFTIPRPLEAAPGFNKFYSVTGEESVHEILAFEGPFEAQGNVSSTTVNNSFINAGGDMPIQDIGVTASAAATQELAADVEIPFPLDNPPLSSGAIPVEQSFPGMASSHGVRPTRDLQLKPSALSRQQMEIFNPAETKLETLLAHRCLLTKIVVNKSMPAGTELYKITLNSRMGLAEGKNIPINVSILNQFMFWRGDIELSFVSVQTRFHSVRLQALMAYGSPGLVLGSRNVSYSSVLGFASDDNGTNYVHREIIPYNAQTEFLRTYEGEGATDLIQNYSLGTFGLYVLNSLIAPDTVSPEVEVLIFVRFLDPKLAVPRPNSPFTWNQYLEYTPLPTWGFQGTEFSRRNISRLEWQRVLYSRTALSNVNWINDEVPPTDAVYDIINSGFRIEFVFRSIGLGQTARFVLENPYIVVESGFLCFFHSNEIPSETWYSTASFIQLSEHPVVLRERVMPPLFEAQGPSDDVTEEQVNPVATGENIDKGEVNEMTMKETDTRRNIPCKLEIGEKFEFTITDIHEVARRYIRMTPVNNETLDQFAVISRTVGEKVVTNLNIGVQPQSQWRALFAAWAGSVKFRLFRLRTGEFPQVSFVPFYNRDVNNPGIPIIDAVNGITFQYRDVAFDTTTAITGPLAREMFYPISDAAYIDVSAPFQSHYNFCYNSKTQFIAPISSGTLSVMSESEDVPIIFTAFGDDLRLGIFRPPRLTRFDLSVYVDGVGGFQQPSPTLSATSEMSAYVSEDDKILQDRLVSYQRSQLKNLRMSLPQLNKKVKSFSVGLGGNHLSSAGVNPFVEVEEPHY